MHGTIPCVSFFICKKFTGFAGQEENMREFLRSKEELLKEFGSNPQMGLTNDKAAENRANTVKIRLREKSRIHCLKGFGTRPPSRCF